MKVLLYSFLFLIFNCLCLSLSAQHPEGGHTDSHSNHVEPAEAAASTHSDAHAEEAHASGCGHSLSHEGGEFKAGELAIHHIGDFNAIHIVGETWFHLPCILYAPGEGFTVTTTAAFHPHEHGNGTIAKNGYVLVEGNVMRVQDPAFPKGEVPVGEPSAEEKLIDGKERLFFYTQYNGACYALDRKTTFDGGIMGGGVTSFYDFSITRNVFTMLLSVIALFLMFRAAARAYAARPNQAPKGIQNFLEPFVVFIRDEVAKPNIPHHYERYLPYLLTVFFFILGLNLIGQLPFFPGSANVTGNISVTLVLAVLTFLLTNFTANKHYWEHTLWMPGVPPVLKVLILTPVEILGLFLRPFTLMLRLFANITAGHIVIISFVSLIFIFANKFGGAGGATIGAAASIPLTLFMMALELLVAFLQAFIFTMLSAVYFGMATEEAHH